jgi:DNA-3-methyladenine glycosylase I
LKKRENFRKAFDGFDFNKVARYDTGKRRRPSWPTRGSSATGSRSKGPLPTPGRSFAVRKEFGSFDRYIWNFTGGKTLHNGFETIEGDARQDGLERAHQRGFKNRGFKFVGPTIVYSHMQATGMVNDHLKDCFRYKKLRALDASQSV